MNNYFFYIWLYLIYQKIVFFHSIYYLIIGSLYRESSLAVGLLYAILTILGLNYVQNLLSADFPLSYPQTGYF